jgi:hypothetical protein
MSHHTPIGWNPTVFERRGGLLLLRMRADQRRVDVQDGGPARIHAAVLEAGTRGSWFHTRQADLGLSRRDPPQHGRGRLIQTRTPSAATRPVEAGRSDSAACRCRRSPPARGQRCRYIHSHPATIMHRDEPAAGQRCGQPDPVRQRPHRDGTCERQPLRPRSKLHLRSAFQTTGIELPAVRSFPTCKVLSPFYITRVSRSGVNGQGW